MSTARIYVIAIYNICQNDRDVMNAARCVVEKVRLHPDTKLEWNTRGDGRYMDTARRISRSVVDTYESEVAFLYARNDGDSWASADSDLERFKDAFKNFECNRVKVQLLAASVPLGAAAAYVVCPHVVEEERLSREVSSYYVPDEEQEESHPVCEDDEY